MPCSLYHVYSTMIHVYIEVENKLEIFGLLQGKVALLVATEGEK